MAPTATAPRLAYGASKLVADKSGRFTSSAGGDPFNAFRGYMTEQGGQFGTRDGGAPAAPTGPTIADRLKALNLNFGDVKAEDLLKLATPGVRGSEMGDVSGMEQRLLRGETLTPAEQFLVGQKHSLVPNLFRAQNSINPDGSTRVDGWVRDNYEGNPLGGATNLSDWEAAKARDAEAGAAQLSLIHI